jgi:hypothetical protein
MLPSERQKDIDPVAVALIDTVIPALFEAIHYAAQAVNEAERTSGRFAEDDAKQRLMHDLGLYLFLFEEYIPEHRYPILSPHQLADLDYARDFFDVPKDLQPDAPTSAPHKAAPANVHSTIQHAVYKPTRAERLLAGQFPYAAVGQKVIASVLPALATNIERTADELAREYFGKQADIITRDAAAGALINALADVLVYGENQNEDETTPLMTLAQMKDDRYARAWFQLPAPAESAEA